MIRSLGEVGQRILNIPNGEVLRVRKGRKGGSGYIALQGPN